MISSPSLISTPAIYIAPRLFSPATPPPLTAALRRRSTAEVRIPVKASVSLGSVAVSSEEQEAAAAEEKIGARVRVTAPVKVYHVPKVPEIDLIGREGRVKQYVGVWKGKRISANLPFRVEFVADVEGRTGVKFFAHLKEDEFEYLD